MGSVEYLDVEARRGNRRITLDGDLFAIGRSEANDVVLADDPSVSRGHAALERLPSGWLLRDLGSRNGTLVNGRRILAEHLLHPGDTIQIGNVRMTFVRAPSEPRDDTVGPERAPDLTPRERDVLVELCRPAPSDDAFAEPASIHEIAQRLFVTEAAIKQHLARLYDKFGLHDQGDHRRVRLANEAVRRGVVTLADLEGDRTQQAGRLPVEEPTAHGHRD